MCSFQVTAPKRQAGRQAGCSPGPLSLALRLDTDAAQAEDLPWPRTAARLPAPSAPSRGPALRRGWREQQGGAGKSCGRLGLGPLALSRCPGGFIPPLSATGSRFAPARLCADCRLPALQPASQVTTLQPAAARPGLGSRPSASLPLLSSPHRALSAASEVYLAIHTAVGCATALTPLL